MAAIISHVLCKRNAIMIRLSNRLKRFKQFKIGKVSELLLKNMGLNLWILKDKVVK